MLDRFARVLTGREDTLLVVVGYSFGDEHLNAVIFELACAIDHSQRSRG